MSDAKEVEFSLKVFINKEKTKVLFAEVNNDFADVLLSFLELPLGKIIKTLEKHYGDKAPSIGSLTSLLKGLANPGMLNLWNIRGKKALENPTAVISHQNELKFSVDYTPGSVYAFGKPYSGVYTRSSASFIISDDLLLVPNAMGSSVMHTLGKLGIAITDMQEAEMRNVTFGFKEIIHLLKGSLTSRTPLSDLVLDKRLAKFATVKSEPRVSLDHIKNEITSKKMTLKIMFQKSTKKLLFAQTEEDFVDFLFSLLMIPLGLVEWLFRKNTGLNNIDNLYGSIADQIDDKYFKDRELKNRLMKPMVSTALYCYLPLKEPSSPRYWNKRGDRVFVEGSRAYMVTDDLTVTRLCVSSSLSVLNEMKISLSDVEEVELQIGVEEALSVVKSSLTSTFALTDGLIKPKLNKQPKQEE